jgi:hypothetical protein
VIDSSRTGDGGTLFVQSAQVPYAPDVPREQRIPIYRKDAPRAIPQVTWLPSSTTACSAWCRRGKR